MKISITRDKRYDDHIIVKNLRSKTRYDFCNTIFDLVIDGIYIGSLEYGFIDNKIGNDIPERVFTSKNKR